MDELKELADRIRAIYDAQPERPLLMAKLGFLLKQEGINLPGGCKLSEVLEHVPSLKIIAYEDRPLVKYVQEVSEGEVKELHLRNSLIRAFTIPLPEEKKIFFSTRHPFQYLIADSAPSDTYVEIEPSYRLPGVVGQNLRDTQVEKEIREKIAEWANFAGLSNEVLYYKTSRSVISSFRKPASSMLDRLLQCQSPEVRKNMRIPGDIAYMLLSQK